MHILCLGINHTSAPLRLRERAAFSEEQVLTACARLVESPLYAGEFEMVLLSTCNRIEIYAAAASLSFAELEAFLSNARAVSLAVLDPHLYRLVDAQAVQHLMEVAGGLDSLVLGEPQILGQVARALELAQTGASAGPLLTRLFQAAIHAGKRVRSETAISRNAASVPALAAGLCERFMPGLPCAQVVVVGAGDMAGLAVEALRKRGVERLLVVNRSSRRAHTLAARWGAETEPFENLSAAVQRADILISSTAAQHLLVSAGMVADAMRQRPERPLLMIDISVPRNIDPQAACLPNVHLFDIDQLNTDLERALAGRAAQVPQVMAILAEEQEKFLAFIETLEVLPLISGLRRQAEAIRRLELEKTLRRLPDLSAAERAHVEAMSRAIVSKLLASPTDRLRSGAASAQGAEVASLARALFDLPLGVD